MTADAVTLHAGTSDAVPADAVPADAVPADAVPADARATWEAAAAGFDEEPDQGLAEALTDPAYWERSITDERYVVQADLVWTPSKERPGGR